jgi:hypothetical protein
MDPYREPAAQPKSTIRRYTASGQGGLVALLDVLGAAVFAGVIAGAAEGFVEQWISLLLVFPAVIGLSAGGAASWMIGKKRLRAPRSALVVAALGGMLGYCATHVVAYERFRGAVIADAVAGGEPDGEAALDASLVQETGHAGIQGYMIVAARVGISITNAGGSSKDAPMFTGIAAWIFWLAELAVAAGIAGWMAKARANLPFCDACDAWFNEAGVNLVVSATGPRKRARHIEQAVDAGALEAIGRELSPPGNASSFVMFARTCTTCSTNTALTLKHVSSEGNKMKVTDYATWIMARPEAQAIADAVAAARRGTSEA